MSITVRATTVARAPSPALGRGYLRRLFAASLISLILLSSAFGQPVQIAESQQTRQAAFEQHKIDYLIQSVAALKGASFIRNGKAYDATKAASHMRLKMRFAGSKIHTAEDFIIYCGTSSSASGTKYTIRFADGHSVDSASFLRHKLAEYSPPPVPAHAMH